MEKKFIDPELELISLNEVIHLHVSSYGDLTGTPDDDWFEEEV